MPKALLIDDEATARADLRSKLAAHPGVAVVGEAATLRAARALLAGADYDLVFLDVALIGGDSFQLVPEVRRGASIVFATAHDRYAARAFESAAVDYLLKPIDPARLAEALHRAAAAHTGHLADDATAEREWTAGAPPGVPGQPAMLEGYAEVALTGHERVYLRQCLEAWEDSLPVTHILRAATDHGPRAVRYARGAEPTRLFLAEAVGSLAGRWWRALRAHL